MLTIRAPGPTVKGVGAMMEEREILVTFSSIRRETLYVWIDRGWLSPEPPPSGESGFRFRDIDVARLRLIEEFRRDLGLADDALDVVLPLLDSVYGLRHRLQQLATAVGDEPEEVRKRISARLQQ